MKQTDIKSTLGKEDVIDLIGHSLCYSEHY